MPLLPAMKSTVTKIPMGSINRVFSVLLFLFLALSPLFSQGGSLPAEISRLEKLSSGSPSAEQYDAFLRLVRLNQLSGNTEAALKASDAALAAYPGDDRFLLEQGRLLLSLGEYEKAAAVITTLLREGKDGELLIQGRLLGAQLEAFRSSNTRLLTVLAEDPDFTAYRSVIYYTLWKLTGLASWQTRLATEYSRSPEAKIASGGADSAPTPLWLLFPGRDSVGVAAAQTPAQGQVSSPAPAPVAQIPAAVAALAPAASGGSLQTGLFGREENAKALADRLRKAGFQPEIVPRKVNGNDYWAVLVSASGDMNGTIKILKDAGFESFPVTSP